MRYVPMLPRRGYGFAGFWHGVGNLSGALVPTKTCIPDEQHEEGGPKATRVAPMFAERIENR